MARITGLLGSNATRGERAVYARLSTYLEDNPTAFVYYEPCIGGYHPDFLVIAPSLGVVLFEVKDYAPAFLVQVSGTGPWVQERTNQRVELQNPFDQIYQYRRAVQTVVSFCPTLASRQPPVPVLQVVVMTSVPEGSRWGREIARVAPKRVRVFFSEVLERNRRFARALAAGVRPNTDLDSDTLRLLRGNLARESRLPTLRQNNLDALIPSVKLLQILDRRQERLAYNLGPGHRLFFGVAGSGKTVLLVARTRYLADRHPDWRILVLCFNRGLARYLFQLIHPQNFTAEVDVNTFHGWAKEFITSAGPEYAEAYNQAWRDASEEHTTSFFYNEFVPALLKEVTKLAPAPRFDAILIDEAQDWAKGWFPPVLALLNPETNSLLVTLDGLQGLYARRHFTWKEVGVQAVGRVKKLRSSYRNPARVGRLAFDLLPESLSSRLGTEEEFVAPEEFRREGGTVRLEVATSRAVEYRWVVDQLQAVRAAAKYKTIAVIFRKAPATMRREDHPFLGRLEEAQIAWTELRYWTRRPSDAVFIGTPQGAKGLEVDAVFVPELDHYFLNDMSAHQLLFVALTRALHAVYLSASRKTPIVRRAQKVLADLG